MHAPPLPLFETWAKLASRQHFYSHYKRSLAHTVSFWTTQAIYTITSIPKFTQRVHLSHYNSPPSGGKTVATKSSMSNHNDVVGYPCSEGRRRVRFRCGHPDSQLGHRDRTKASTSYSKSRVRDTKRRVRVTKKEGYELLKKEGTSY